MAKTKKDLQAAIGGQADSDEKQTNLDSPVSSIDGLEVIAILDGFRRGGIVWSTKPQQVRLSDLSDKQAELIMSCPGLRVNYIEVMEDE